MSSQKLLIAAVYIEAGLVVQEVLGFFPPQHRAPGKKPGTKQKRLEKCVPWGLDGEVNWHFIRNKLISATALTSTRGWGRGAPGRQPRDLGQGRAQLQLEALPRSAGPGSCCLPPALSASQPRQHRAGPRRAGPGQVKPSRTRPSQAVSQGIPRPRPRPCPARRAPPAAITWGSRQKHVLGHDGAALRSRSAPARPRPGGRCPPRPRAPRALPGLRPPRRRGQVGAAAVVFTRGWKLFEVREERKRASSFLAEGQRLLYPVSLTCQVWVC